MRLKIYQIDPVLDMTGAMFRPMDFVDKVDPAIYRKVFDSELEADDLDDIYRIFNTKMHPLHNGRSMSRSDILVTDEGAFYVDSVGFKKINFDESKVNTQDLIRVLYVEPLKEPVEAFIPDTLDAKQHAVGGLIEFAYIADDAAIVCDEEGKLKGKEGNRYLDTGDVIAGPFLIVGLTEDSCRSLTREEVSMYKAKFMDAPDISPAEAQAQAGFGYMSFY